MAEVIENGVLQKDPSPLDSSGEDVGSTSRTESPSTAPPSAPPPGPPQSHQLQSTTTSEGQQTSATNRTGIEKINDEGYVGGVVDEERPSAMAGHLGAVEPTWRVGARVHGAKEAMLLHMDPTPTRVVAYIQNIPNRYIPVAALHFLFANDILMKDKKYRQLLKEAGNQIDPEESADLEKLELIWEQELVGLAKSRPHEMPPLIAGCAVLPTSDYYEAGGSEYMPDLIRGPWVHLVPQNGCPNGLLCHAKLHPAIRLALSFYTLAQTRDGHKNMGFAFSSFRTRELLDRYNELMDGRRVTPWSEKRVAVRLAYHKKFSDLEQHFKRFHRDGAMQTDDNIFWFDESKAECQRVAIASNELWNKQSSTRKNKSASGKSTKGGGVSKGGKWSNGGWLETLPEGGGKWFGGGKGGKWNQDDWGYSDKGWGGEKGWGKDYGKDWGYSGKDYGYYSKGYGKQTNQPEKGWDQTSWGDSKGDYWRGGGSKGEPDYWNGSKGDQGNYRTSDPGSGGSKQGPTMQQRNSYGSSKNPRDKGEQEYHEHNYLGAGRLYSSSNRSEHQNGGTPPGSRYNQDPRNGGKVGNHSVHGQSWTSTRGSEEQASSPSTGDLPALTGSARHSYYASPENHNAWNGASDANSQSGIDGAWSQQGSNQADNATSLLRAVSLIRNLLVHEHDGEGGRQSE